MRTAVLMAGDARTFRDCFPSLEACILSPNRCDLFLHLYETDRANDVLRLYRPKGLLVEKKDAITFPVPPECNRNRPPEANPFSTMCQWRNIQKAFDLIDGHYDCVLKTRYDVKYTNPLILDSFEMDVLNVPIGGDWRGGLFDMFAFGSHAVMRNYCYLFPRIEEYCKLGIPCHSETLNAFNNRTTKINRFDYTVLLRKQFDNSFEEDRVFTLRTNT